MRCRSSSSPEPFVLQYLKIVTQDVVERAQQEAHMEHALDTVSNQLLAAEAANKKVRWMTDVISPHTPCRWQTHQFRFYLVQFAAWPSMCCSCGGVTFVCVPAA